MRFIFLILSLLATEIRLVEAGVQLMSAHLGGGGGGMVKGSSFNLDTKNPRMTRVHGNGIKIDLELLEIATSGGVMRYSPTHVEFQKGQVRWITMFQDGKLSLHHNDRAVVQIYAPDESPYYLFSMQGNAAFRDVVLDKTLSQQIDFQLCIVDSVFDQSITQEQCKKQSEGNHHTVSHTLETLAKSILFISEKVEGAQSSVQEAIIHSVRQTLVQPMEDNMLALRNSLYDRVANVEKGLSTSSENFDKTIQDTLENMTALLDAQLSVVKENTTALFETVHVTFGEQLNSLNISVENIINITLASIQDELDTTSRSLRANISFIEEEALPMMRVMVQEEYEAHVKEAVATLRKEIISNFTAMNESLRVWVEALVGELGRNVTADLEVVHGNISATSSRLDDLNESVSFSLSELSARSQDDMRAIQQSISALVRENITALSLKLEDLSENVTKEFGRWNNEIKLEMDTRLNETSLMLQRLTNSSEEGLAALRTNIMSVSDYAGNSTARLQTQIDNSSNAITVLSANTSNAIAKSNSILAKVISEVNSSLVNFMVNTSEDLSQLSASISQDILNLNNSLSKSVEVSVGELNESLSNTSAVLNDRIAFIDENITGRLNNLTLDTSSRLDSLLEQLNLHESINTATLMETQRVIDDLNTTTTSTFTAYSLSTASSLDALNTTLRQSLSMERNMTAKGVSVLSLDVAEALQDMRRVISSIAAVIFVDTDNLMHTTAGSTALPANGKLNQKDQHSLDNFRKKRLVSEDLSKSRTPKNGKGKVIEDEDDVTESDALLRDEDWDAYDAIQSEYTQTDILKSDLEVTRARLLSTSEEIRRNMSNNMETSMEQVNASKQFLLDHLSVTNSSLLSSLSALNESLIQVNDSHELKFTDIRQALQDAQSTCLDYIRTVSSVSHANMSAIAHQTWINHSLLNDTIIEISDVLRKLSDERYVEYTAAVASLQRNISQVNLTAAAALNELNTSTRVFLAQMNSSLNSLVGDTAYTLEGGIQSVSGALDTHRALTEQKIQVLNNSHISAVTDITLMVNEVHRALNGSLSGAVSKLEESSATAHSRINTSISALALNASSSVASLKDHVHQEVAGVNITIDGMKKDYLSTQTELTSFQADQKAMWTTHDSAFDVFMKEYLSSQTSLASQLDRDKRQVYSAIEAKVLEASDVLGKSIDGVNGNLSRHLELNKNIASMRLMEVNSSFFSSIQRQQDALEAFRTDTTNNLAKEVESLRTLVTTTSDDDRKKTQLSLTAVSDSLSAALTTTNTSLRTEMAALSSHLDNSLSLSVSNHKDILAHFKTAIDGNISLATYRIGQSEAKLLTVEDMARMSASELAKISSDVDAVTSKSRELASYKDQSQQAISSLHRQVESNERSLYHIGNISSTLTAQLQNTQQGLVHLSQNCSMNTEMLKEMFAHVKTSISTAQEMSTASQARATQLSTGLDANSARIAAIENCLGGSSLPELKQEFMESVTSHRHFQETTKTALEKAKSSLSEMQSLHLENDKRVSNIEMRLSGVVEYNLSSIKNSVDTALSKTASLVDDLKSDSKRTTSRLEEKLEELQKQDRENVQRLAAMEVKVEQQERKIAELFAENERLRRVTASQDSVDDLRKLLQELQGSMVAQSSKILDLVVSNLASGKGN